MEHILIDISVRAQCAVYFGNSGSNEQKHVTIHSVSFGILQGQGIGTQSSSSLFYPLLSFQNVYGAGVL